MCLSEKERRERGREQEEDFFIGIGRAQVACSFSCATTESLATRDDSGIDKGLQIYTPVPRVRKGEKSLHRLAATRPRLATDGDE